MYLMEESTFEIVNFKSFLQADQEIVLPLLNTSLGNIRVS